MLSVLPVSKKQINFSYYILFYEALTKVEHRESDTYMCKQDKVCTDKYI